MHVRTHLDVDLVAIERTDQIHLLLELQAPEPPERTDRVEQTLIVVLDHSGSMSGPPLDAAKHALTALVKRLDPRDRFGLIAFDHEADLIVPTAPMHSHRTDDITAAIEAIQAGGGTDISGGYLLALSQARHAKTPAGATIVLISDGQANSGECSPTVLGELAQTQALARITTTTIGVGDGYDEVLLAALARGGNGAHLGVLDDVDQLLPAIADQVSGLLGKAVAAISVTIRPVGTGLGAVRVLHDLPAAHLDDQVTIQIGDLTHGQTRRLLLQLHIPAMSTLGLTTVADVVVRYTELPALIEHQLTLPVTVNVVPDDHAAGRVPQPLVTAERLRQQAQHTKRDAIHHLRHGNADTAHHLLTDEITRLEKHLTTADPETGADLQDEVHELDQLRRLTEQGNTERTVKTAYQSINTSTRSARRRRF